MKREQIVIGVSLAVFLLIPFLSSNLLCQCTDSLLGRFVLLGVLLYSITLGTTPAIFAFLAIAALFAERNRLRIYRAQEYVIAHGSPALNKPFRSTPEQVSESPESTGMPGIAAMYDTTPLDILDSSSEHITNEKEVLDVAQTTEKQAEFYVVKDLLPVAPLQQQQSHE